MCISQKPGVKREQISKIKFQNRTEMQPKNIYIRANHFIKCFEYLKIIEDDFKYLKYFRRI